MSKIFDDKRVFEARHNAVPKIDARHENYKRPGGNVEVFIKSLIIYEVHARLNPIKKKIIHKKRVITFY